MLATGVALGLHGGCGTLSRNLQSETDWNESRLHMANALRAGWMVLKAGGTSLDAVQLVVVILEDSPHFNAGYGSALTERAEHELDAAIMDGATLAAGAVCMIKRVKNPIRAARAVMQSNKAVLIAGAAADEFAQLSGLEMVDPSYFTTHRRVEALKLLQHREATGVILPATEAEKHGTVGAVARDINGHLAAATSTGGFNNKPAGRIGDSPIVGAGTYAKDGVCAVSCTGQGEIFLRRVAAYDLAARISYGAQPLADAAKDLVFDTLSSHDIGAGLVCIGATGDPVALYNTLGMYRGWVTTKGEMFVATHEDLHELGTL